MVARLRAASLALIVAAATYGPVTGAHGDAVDGTLAPLPSVTEPSGLSSLERRLYRAIFGSQGEWAPRGAPVADTGFRPSPDGFSFLNYGSDFRLNQRFFAQPRPLRPRARPAREVRLAPRDLRLVFGDGVCLPGQQPAPGGDCVLTEAAEQVRLDARLWGRAGHCYGMTTLAAGLFSGALDRASIGAGKTNVLTPLSPAVQRAIGRFTVAGHFGVPAVLGEPIDATVARLRGALELGTSPLTLLLYGSVGGHAVLPFAVLDRGAGLVDIAVYDPNFPGQPRAVHVDTGAGTWEYDGSALPSVEPLRWSSAGGSTIGLGFIPPMLGIRSCPFCRTGPAEPARVSTTITFSPVRAENSMIFESLRLTDSRGRTLDPSRYTVIPPIDGGTDWVNGPVIRVSASTPFVVSLDGSRVRTGQPLTVTAYRPGDVSSVRIDEILPGSGGVLGFGSLGGRVLVRAAPTREMVAVQALDTPRASYRVTAVQETAGESALLELDVRTRQRLATVVAFGDSGPSNPLALALRSRSGDGQSTYRVRGIVLPRGARIVVRYRDWRGPVGAPEAWIDRGSDGTLDARIPLERR